MQSFWTRVKAALSKFMIGRHGVDQFSIALLYVAIALNLLSLIPALGILSTIALILLVYSIFRIYSRNNEKRYRENAWYLKRFGGIPTKARQAFNRLKNRKQYVYFDCPQCRAKLRLPRNVGEVKITCGECGHAFTRKA